MASALARDGGERQALLSAIRQKLTDGRGAVLRPCEAVMVLEWAIDCDESELRSELLNIFAATGGLEIFRKAVGVPGPAGPGG
ncbi:hypothetical protein AAFO92_05085 [Roseovarius sp. CAU 1744]|uniref:hypothetical protein n=1 Tax=Roseovarius sp. CAU 1744 TaxID=3140368 RepID=UPI00325BF5FA